MRPQLLPAEATARLNLQPPARPINRSEAPSSEDDFLAVLKRIRSARSEPCEQPPPDEPGGRREPVSDDRPADESRVPASAEAVPTDGARPDDKQASRPEQSCDEAPESLPESVAPHAQETEGGSGEVKPGRSPAATPRDVFQMPELAEPTPIPTRRPPDASGRVKEDPQRIPQSPTPLEPMPAPEGADGPVTQPRPAARSVAAEVADPTDDDADAATSSEQGLRNRSMKAQRADGAVPEDRSADSLRNLFENGQRRLMGERQTTREGSRDLDKGPSIQARKIAIAESGLDAELKAAEPSPSGAAAGRQVRAGFEALHASVSKSVQSAPVSVGSAIGDSAAASIGAFMLSTPATDGGTGGQSATAFVAATAQSGTAASAGPAAPGASLSVQAGDISAALSSAVVEGPLSLADGAKILAASNTGSRHEVTLRLEPPELGQLRVQIRMQHQAMTMHVDADSPVVARLIESRLSDLRDALAMHGIRMDRADVVVRSPSPSDANTQQQNPQQGGWADQSRWTGDEFAGWHAYHGQTTDSQEQQAAWQSNSGELSDSDMSPSLAVADEVRTGMELTPTTELSLDLVA